MQSLQGQMSNKKAGYEENSFWPKNNKSRVKIEDKIFQDQSD